MISLIIELVIYYILLIWLNLGLSKISPAKVIPLKTMFQRVHTSLTWTLNNKMKKYVGLLHNHLYHIISVIKNKNMAFMGQLSGLWDIFTTQNYTLTYI